MSVIQEVLQERSRQESLKAAGKFRFTCADEEMTDPMRLAVLMEETGEVATEVLRAGGDEPGFVDYELAVKNMRKELIQVAAVAIAWIEGLDKGEATLAAVASGPRGGGVCEVARQALEELHPGIGL